MMMGIKKLMKNQSQLLSDGLNVTITGVMGAYLFN